MDDARAGLLCGGKVLVDAAVHEQDLPDADEVGVLRAGARGVPLAGRFDRREARLLRTPQETVVGSLGVQP